MKKLFLLTIAFLFLNSIYSQNNWGISIGNNWSKMDVKNNYFDDRWISEISNYNLGAFYIRDLNNIIELQADLRYQKKGFSQRVNFASLNGTSTIMNVELNYIDLPLRITTKLNIKNFKILFGVGGYVSYGFNGTINCKASSSTGSDSFETNDIWKKSPDNGMGDPNSTDPEELVYASGYTGLKRLDYGLVSMVGVEYKNIRLSFEYTYGLRKIQIENSYGDMFNHKNYNLSIGYIFNFSKFKSDKEI